MKYAFMSSSCPDVDFTGMLDLAKQYGYDGLEPRVVWGHAHGIELEATPAQRRAIKEQAAESGIALCCLATSCRYADPETAAQQVEETRRYIDLAADVGIPRLRVFGGQIPLNRTRQAAIDGLAQALSAVAGQAEARGVTLCLETHDDWCDPAHVAAVMHQVDHPAVAVLWDLMHPVRVAGASMDIAFETLQPWIRHVHFHDGTNSRDNLELRPVGQGFYDHKRALELLTAAGYDGYLSGEWINWEPYDVHLPRELAAMKTYEAELAG